MSIPEIIAEIRRQRLHDGIEIRTDRALALCESHEAQERDNASLADRLSGAELERDALGAQCEALIAERDQLKAEVEELKRRADEAYRAHVEIHKGLRAEVARLQEAENKALNKVAERYRELCKAREDNASLGAEVARLQKERDELEEVCCDNLTELVAVLQPYELSLGPNVKLVDVIAQLTLERDEARELLGWDKIIAARKEQP